MPGITISAGYGAGGSIIAPAVARKLGLSYLDRAISSRVADQLDVSVADAEEGVISRSLVDRVLAALAPLSDGAFVPVKRDQLPDGRREADQFRVQSETIMREALQGGAVILGRAGSAAFRHLPDVLRVRLFGPVEARAAQAAHIETVDLATARVRLPEVDRARAHYVRRLYGVDIDDPEVFHLQLDSTSIPFDTCIDIIASAYTAYRATSGRPSTADDERTADADPAINDDPAANDGPAADGSAIDAPATDSELTS
jgi:cytidylate kinase